MVSWKSLENLKELKKASAKILRVWAKNQLRFEILRKNLNLHKKISMIKFYLKIFPAKSWFRLRMSKSFHQKLFAQSISMINIKPFLSQTFSSIQYFPVQIVDFFQQLLMMNYNDYKSSIHDIYSGGIKKSLPPPKKVFPHPKRNVIFL